MATALLDRLPHQEEAIHDVLVEQHERPVGVLPGSISTAEWMAAEAVHPLHVLGGLAVEYPDEPNKK